MINRLIILAAGEGTRLRPLTDKLPKGMVPLHGIPLIHWQIQAAKEAGIKEIIIVGGYHHETLRIPETTLVVNPRFAVTNMVESLLCAHNYFGDPFLVSYGDIVYRSSVIKQLMNTDDSIPISVVVDLLWKEYWQKRFSNILSDAESLKMNDKGEITNIGQKVHSLDDIEAQYIGLIGFQEKGVLLLKEISKNERHRFEKRFMTDLLQELVSREIPIRAVPIQGNWLEIDSLSDLKLAEALTSVEQGQLFWKHPNNP